MQVRWEKKALADLDRIHLWLSALPHANADRTVQRIETAANGLARRDVGRPSQLPGQKELSVPNAPHVVVYVVGEGFLAVQAVFHTSEDR